MFLSAKHPTFSNCVKQASAKVKTFQVITGILRMVPIDLVDSKTA